MQDLCMIFFFVQDLSVRMSASRSCIRTSCARFLYEDLLCKMSASRCVTISSVGLLVQDLYMRISCAKCVRSPQLNLVGALVQDRCVRIFCVRCLCQDLLGSSRAFCARSLSADLLCKLSLSRCLHQNPVMCKISV